MKHHLKDFLIIDIETASGNEDLENLSPALQKHWDKKSAFIKNSEEKSASELYHERAAIYAEFGKVIVIAIGFYHKKNEHTCLRVRSLASHDEEQLLSDFKDFIETHFDQDNLRLCAHNGKEFDFPYLCRRMLVNGIKIPWALNLSGKKPWEVNHVDTMELWKFGDWKNFTSLELLTTLFDIPSSKTDMDGSMVSKTYYQEEDGLEKIASYCRRDVVATAQLYLRLHNLPIVAEDNIQIVTK
ncbi:MAG: 3'-5' exonuclease [Bacteroidota bacterium]